MVKIYLVTVGVGDDGYMIDDDDTIDLMNGIDKHFVFNSLDEANKCFEEQVGIMYKECLVEENKRTMFVNYWGLTILKKHVMAPCLGIGMHVGE